MNKPQDTNILDYKQYPVAPFPNPISLETDYRTTEEIKFYIKDKRLGILNCKIEKGFETDLASIPKPLMCFIQRDENFILMASIIHDWLIKKIEHVPTIKEINQTFKDIMFFVIRKRLKNKLSKRIKAHLCYWAVCFYFLFKR